MMHRLKWLAVFFLFLSATSLAAQESVASDSPRCEMRIVLFTPADVDVPPGVEKRIAQIIDYTRQFFDRGMTQQGYKPARSLRAPLNEKGQPVILYVKGKHDQASGKYDQLGYRDEVIQTAAQTYGVPTANQVWWVFSYPGPPNRAYRGGGNAMNGGYSSANYKIVEGDILTTTELSSGLAQEFLLKATIHELGHALGLPHLGPLQKDQAGNSLMGPVTKAYASRYPDDTRVYLTKTSAAMLYKHPLFNPLAKHNKTLAEVQLLDFKLQYNASQKTITATGQLKSDQAAHSVIIAVEPSGRSSPYWRKSFTQKINSDNTFSVTLDEMAAPQGNLKIVFAFDNGALKGETNRLGLEGGIVKPYNFATPSP